MLRERFAEVEQGAFQRLAQHRVGLAFAERKSDLLDALACGETAGRGRAARRDHRLDPSDRRRELGKIVGERVGHRRNRTAAQRRFGTRQRIDKPIRVRCTIAFDVLAQEPAAALGRSDLRVDRFVLRILGVFRTLRVVGVVRVMPTMRLVRRSGRNVR